MQEAINVFLRDDTEPALYAVSVAVVCVHRASTVYAVIGVCG
jgi:hypothetical protein